MNENSIKIINKLEYEGLISKINFDITENLLEKFMKEYSILTSGDDEINLSKKDKRLARKLAGLNLLKYKLNYLSYSEIKEGLVYLISNPAWKDYLKVGMTIDLNSRINSYQVYDPLRRFRVERYEFVSNRRHTESNILNSYGINLDNGEWIKNTDSNKIMESVRTNNWKFPII